MHSKSYQQRLAKVTRMIPMLGSLVLFAGCAPMVCDNSFAGRQWERGMLDGRYFSRIHQPKKARRCFSEALGFASAPGMPPFKHVASLSALAELAYKDENFSDAQRLYGQAVAETDAVLKRGSLQPIDRVLYQEDLARCLTGEGRCLLQLEKQEEALSVLRKAVETFSLTGPKKFSYEQNDAIAALIDALMLNRFWPEAGKYCDAALSQQDQDGYTPLLLESLRQKRVLILQASGKHQESVSEKNLPAWRTTMSAASRLLKEDKQFEAAAAEYRRAIEFASAMQSNELPLSLSYMGLADCYAWLRKFPEGLECLSKALKLRQAAHADDDETTDRLLKRMINFSFELNSRDTESLLQKQLELRRKLYADTDERVGETLALKARFYIQEKKLSEARTAALKAFSVMGVAKSSGRAAATAAVELGETLRMCGLTAPAEQMYWKSYEILSHIPATAGSRRAVLLMRAASIAELEHRGAAAARYEELAEKEYSQGLTADRERIRTAMVLATYAEAVLLAHGERTEASQLFGRVKAMCEKSQAADAEEAGWKTTALSIAQRHR